jgi:hypothetical protein
VPWWPIDDGGLGVSGHKQYVAFANVVIFFLLKFVLCRLARDCSEAFQANGVVGGGAVLTMVKAGPDYILHRVTYGGDK